MRTKYAGTALGWLWVWLGPILFIGLYAVVLQFLMRAQPPSLGDAAYILQLIAGLSPFLMFSQAVSTASGALIEDKALLLNAVFPAELIPLRNVIASCVPLAVGTTVALVVHVSLWGLSTPLALLPIVVFCFIAFIVGVVWLVALTALVIPDITQVINYSMMILLIATPIGYPFDVAQGVLKLLVQLNPLSYFVVPMQSILARGEWPPIEFTIGGVLIGLVCFHGMFIIFEKVKRVALDYI
jgi:lipopolysaccharide transport system permease protein